MPKHVLIIDDDEVNNFICEQIFEKSTLDAEVKTLTSGKEAIDFLIDSKNAGNNLPDLIFLDLNMPVYSGWDFILDYEQEFEPFGTKLIVFSSSVYQEDIDRAKSYDSVTDYKTKPITMRLLEEIKSEYFSAN